MCAMIIAKDFFNDARLRNWEPSSQGLCVRTDARAFMHVGKQTQHLGRRDHIVRLAGLRQRVRRRPKDQARAEREHPRAERTTNTFFGPEWGEVRGRSFCDPFSVRLIHSHLRQ